ncbi:MAG: hypothetical protein ACTS6H_00520 [Candidatus Hodgkinia cicadicola]
MLIELNFISLRPEVTFSRNVWMKLTSNVNNFMRPRVYSPSAVINIVGLFSAILR